MPLSDAGNFAPIMHEACRLRPNKVLELGIGFGLYGVGLRQYLDIGQGRYNREDWKIEIVGVEGFQAYKSPLWACYNNVYIHDFSTREYKGYDLVLMVDSLEHLDKPCGEKLLDGLVHSNKNVIVSVPNGDFPQGAVNGNELERHRARWMYNDFPVYKRCLHKGTCLIFSIPGRG